MTESGAAKPAFTGTVYLEELGQLPDTGVKVSRVTFQPGARTHWHSHAHGQLLHVVSGNGLIQERGHKIVSFAAGDTLTTAPGVEHWHGATADKEMTHIAVTGGAVTWGEPSGGMP